MSTGIIISLASLALGVIGLVLSRLVTRRVRVGVHKASFVDGLAHGQECYFVTVTNLSPNREVEVTHVWFDTPVNSHVLRAERPLPKRLKVDEVWTTWIPVTELPNNLTTDDVYKLARVRLSTGKVFTSKHNRDVPPFGAVPGGDSPVAPTGTIKALNERSEPTPVHNVRRAFIVIQNQMAPDEAALLKEIADLTEGYHSFLRSLRAPSKQVLDRAIAAHKASQMERLRASFRREGEDESAADSRFETCVHLLDKTGLIEIGDDIITLSALGRRFLESCNPPKSKA